jgi:Protein of unknown function (DUF4240)
MTRERFWSVVEEARGDAGTLEDALSALDPAEIASFQAHFDELFAQAYRWDLWGAAYVIEGGCSDDGFMDFRYALVALGRQRFEAALRDPDSLADADVVSDEDLGYAALRAYEAATGEAPDRPTAHPEEPAGEEWDFDDADEVRTRLPRLAARYLAP